MDTIFFQQLEMLLDCATSNNKESVIVGDFNIDMLGDGSLKERLNRVMNTYQNTLHIHEPTRKTETSSTLLDHTWTSNPECKKQLGAVKTGISDHYMVYEVHMHKTNLQQGDQQHLTKQYRSFKNFHKDAYENKYAQKGESKHRLFLD